MKTISLKDSNIINTVVIMAIAVIIIFSSCSKNNSATSDQNTPNNLVGTYLGNPTSTITLADGSTTNFNYTNRTITISKGSTSSKVIVNSDIILTQIANTTKDGFEIPETLAASVNDMTTKESATGVLAGNKLTVHFVQKIYLKNVLNHTGTWDCVMIKQ
ncbi:hypothetical protein [Pinibacter aurantiacus]|uniref:Uncharacterized protein n=1 Tax=Pinibacter aurantiacus TaxID=2851599 RepID=A0A9E2W4D4_9BACT|nr:hypothetical protein [Pinibacter aurantiacus]MBV4357709.1 hypothetical protein [Pinibacter aurantiacus]